MSILECTAGGVVRANVPFSTYRDASGVNISSLKNMARSPAHYRHALANPSPQTLAMALGTAAHAAVLEPERFASEFAVWNGGIRRGKEWDAFLAASSAAGHTVMTSDEHAAAVAIAEAVRANADAAKYLRTGHPEVSMSWQIGSTPCKGRLDWLTCIDGCDVLVGLKTARDCRMREFGTQAVRLGYHMQWAFYLDGWVAITGRLAQVVEIVVESAAPHCVAVYRIPDAVIDLGRDEYCALIEQRANCVQAGVWPGPCDDECELELPAWAYGAGEILTVEDAL
jgi:exodeoxyribonuclease VIII